MVDNKQMVNGESVIRIRVSEKEFDSNLRFVSKIAEKSKNKGKSILLRKVENKLIMCSGGIKSSVAMVAIDVEGDAGECKGFVNGKDIIDKLSKIKSKSDILEISFNTSKSCIALKNEKGDLAIAFDFIKDVADSEDVDDIVARYRNEIVEKTYRVVRDVRTKGEIVLTCKDFIELEESLKHTAYEVAGDKYVEFRIFKEVQKVKRKLKNSEGIETEILTNELFAILEGVGFSNPRMGICRKYGKAIGLPQGSTEARALVSSELLSHVSSAISSTNEDMVTVSRGLEEMCISAGKARFVFPIKDIVVEDVRMHFNVPYQRKINVDSDELRKTIELLSSYLDQGGKAIQMPLPNTINVMPENKSVVFKGVARDGLPVKRDVEYEVAKDVNGMEYRDFEPNEPLNIHRKYIREFLESCKSKKISLGVNVKNETDPQGNIVNNGRKEVLISIEDSTQGIYGVHHRIKI